MKRFRLLIILGLLAAVLGGCVLVSRKAVVTAVSEAEVPEEVLLLGKTNRFYEIKDFDRANVVLVLHRHGREMEVIQEATIERNAIESGSFILTISQDPEALQFHVSSTAQDKLIKTLSVKESDLKDMHYRSSDYAGLQDTRIPVKLDEPYLLAFSAYGIHPTDDTLVSFSVEPLDQELANDLAQEGTAIIAVRLTLTKAK